jgi:hypothetical protein
MQAPSFLLLASLNTKKKRCDGQSACATQAALLLQVLLLVEVDIEPLSFIDSWTRAHQWALQQWRRLPPETAALLLESILDDPEHHFLTKHRCAAVALETVREAAFVLSHAAATKKHTFYDQSRQTFSFYYLARSCDGDKFKQRLWLRVLHTLLRNSPYALTPTDANAAQTLEWFLPQHMGNGMESLRILHEQRVRVRPRSNSLLLSLLS